MEPLLLSCIESRVENSRNFYGRFQLGPFISGQGLTIANSLRRSLLSEISGLAITAVEIEGAAHEYSTVAGIRESVLDILLNVKEIVLTSDFQFQEPQTAFLQVQGPGIVRASDIKLPISVQCVDPEQYIATLLYDGLLKMKFLICRGKNYLVQTPRGLKIPNSVSASMQAEVYLTKSSEAVKENSNYNSSLSKENDLSESSQEKEKSVLTSKTSNSVINNNVTNDLQNVTTFNSQNNLENSQSYSTNSVEGLLNNNKTDLFSSSTSKKSSNIEQTGDTDKKSLTKKENLFETKNASSASQDFFVSNEDFGYASLQMEDLYAPNKQRDLSEIGEAQNKEFKKNSNILPIDAVFMPINRVNFAIETNDLSEAPKDRVILEIWTNGSIHPKQAINEAAKALIQLIAPFQETRIFKSVFLNSPKVLQKSLSASKTKKDLKVMVHPLLNRNIASLDIGNLDLSLRPYTCLKRAKIETVADLLQYSGEDLLNLKNFGKHSLSEVENNLNQMGLKLRSQKINETQAS